MWFLSESSVRVYWQNHSEWNFFSSLKKGNIFNLSIFYNLFLPNYEQTETGKLWVGFFFVPNIWNNLAYDHQIQKLIFRVWNFSEIAAVSDICVFMSIFKWGFFYFVFNVSPIPVLQQSQPGFHCRRDLFIFYPQWDSPSFCKVAAKQQQFTKWIFFSCLLFKMLIFYHLIVAAICVAFEKMV